MGLVAGGVGAMAFSAKSSLDNAKDPLLPDDKLSARGFFDLLCSFLLSVGDTAMGVENRKYLPFIASLFVFLFFMNIIGLVPGFVMPTDQMQLNLGLAIVVFALYNYWGIKEVGAVAYIKHFAGPVLFVMPLIFPIEVISHLFRPFSLSLRLFGNMFGDHMVLSVFTDLIGFGIPVVFYFLGALVSFVQAFVFAMLTMVYIRMAVAHEEEH